MTELYSPRLMELAAEIAHTGTLTQADGHAENVSRLCGSKMGVDVVMDGDIIADFAILPRACALGQASAAILAKGAIGASRAEVQEARDGLYAMLKNGAAPPTGRFWELRYLEAVTAYPSRHGSVMLAFDTVLDAINNAEDRAGFGG